MLKNPLLQQALAKVQESVTDQPSFDKIRQAMMQTIYNKQMFQQLAAGVVHAHDKLQTVADGIVGLLGTLAQRSQGTMPKEPALQAGFAAMIDVLDFMEQAGLIKVDAAVLEQATKDYVESLLPKTGITAQKLAGALSQVQQVLSDPQRVAAIQAAHQPQGAANGAV